MVGESGGKCIPVVYRCTLPPSQAYTAPPNIRHFSIFVPLILHNL